MDARVSLAVKMQTPTRSHQSVSGKLCRPPTNMPLTTDWLRLSRSKDKHRRRGQGSRPALAHSVLLSYKSSAHTVVPRTRCSEERLGLHQTLSAVSQSEKGEKTSTVSFWKSSLSLSPHVRTIAGCKQNRRRSGILKKSQVAAGGRRRMKRIRSSSTRGVIFTPPDAQWQRHVLNLPRNVEIH